MSNSLRCMKILLFLIAFFKGILNDSCSDQCPSSDSLSSNYDSTCNIGFHFNPTIQACVYDDCQQGLFLQVHESNSQQECVAICDNGYSDNTLTNTCQKLEQCTLAFSTNSNVSRGDTVQNILSFSYENEQYVLIQHSNYFIQIKRQNGVFQQILDYPSDSIQIQKFGENLISLSSNYGVYQLDILRNSQKKLTSISYPKIESYQVELLQISDFIGFFLIDSDRNVAVFGLLLEINTLKLVQIQQQPNSLESQANRLEIPFLKIDQISLFGDFLFLNNNLNLRVFEIVQASTAQIQYKQYNSLNQCSSSIPSKNQIISLQRGIFSSSIIAIFSQVKLILKIDQQSCTAVPTSLYPTESFVASNSNQDYIVVLFQNSIYVFNDQLQFVDSINISPISIIDVVGIQIYSYSNYLITLFVLRSDTTLLQYNLEIMTNSSDPSLLSINFSTPNPALQILIYSPQNLFLLDQLLDPNQNLIFSKRIFIANQDVQSSLIFQSNTQSQSIVEKTQYTISNFELKQKSYKRIVFLLPIESIMLLVGCSRDGQLIAWDISNVFLDQYLYGFQISSDSCVELISFNATNPSDIIAVFAKTIYLVDVISLNIKQVWPQGIQKIKYSVKDNNVALLIDSTFTFFKVNYASQVQLNFNGPINDIQNITFELGSYLLVQRTLSFDLFTVSTSVLTKINTYAASNKITLMKIRNFPSDYQVTNSIKFEIVFYTADQKFSLMNETLSPYQIISNITFSSISDIQFVKSDPTDPYYFILGKTNKTISASPYLLYSIQRGSSIINQLLDYSYASQFLEPTKYLDSYKNTIYDLKVLSNKGAMSTLNSNSFDPTRDIKLMEQVQQILGYIGIKFTASQNKNVLFGRNYQGTINVGNYKVQQYKQLFSLTNQDIQSGRQIVDIYHSYMMNKFFIITNTILVYNIHTRIQEEELTFTINPNDSIIQFQIIKEQFIILSRKSNIILLKNYQSNSVFSIQSTKPFSQFFVYNSQSSGVPSIIVAGDQLMKLDLTLTVQNSLSYPFQATLQQSYFYQQTIICKFNNSQIFLIDYQSFGVSKQISPKFLKTNFQIQVDSYQNRIYLFNTSAEIFSLDGNFIQSYYPGIPGAINDIKIFDSNYTLFLYPSSNIFQFIILHLFQKIYQMLKNNKTEIAILNSTTLHILDTYSIPGDGHIQKVMFIKDFYHLAISSDSIKGGQIFIYSLVQLLQIQVFSNPFSQNDPYIVVDMTYDSYGNIFTYLDQNGNIYSVDYSGAYQNVNTVKIKEFEYDGTTPQALKLNKERNEIYVFNSNVFYVINYGGFTEYQILYSINANNIFTSRSVSLLDSKKASQQTDIFILLGQQNVLYQYSNYQFSYFYYLVQIELIKDISFLSQNQLLLLFSQSYIILEVNLDVDNLQDSVISYQNYILQNNLQFSFFLCPGVFYSMNYQIVKYDFINSKVLYSIPLKPNQIILVSELIVSINSIAIGLNDGTVILFNLDNNSYQSYIIASQSQYVFVRYIIDTACCIWAATTNSQILSINKLNLNLIANYDFSPYQNSIGILLVFVIDDLYNRMYLSYQSDKKISIFDMSQFPNKNITYLSFPNNQFNNIYISDTQIIFYSTSQLNIHDRQSLTYLASIRRQGLYDSIQSVQVFLGKFYFILSQGKFEIIFIDFQKQTQSLVDQVIISNFNVMLLRLESNNILRVVGTSRYQIFDQKYNLNLFLLQNSQIMSQTCGLDLIGLNYMQMTQSFQLIRPDTSQKPSLLGLLPLSTYSINRQLNYYIDKQNLLEMNLNIISQSDIVISPYFENVNNNQNQLQDFILPDLGLLAYNKEELNLKNFNLIFNISSTYEPIIFNNNTNVISLQNISIQNQSLSNAQILFQNLNKIVIQILTIKNMYINFTDDLGEASFLAFLNCSNIYIEQLILKNITFNGPQNYLINFNQSDYIHLKQITLVNCTFTSMIQVINSNTLNIDSAIIYNSHSLDLLSPSPDQQQPDQFPAVFSINAVDVQQIYNITMRNNKDIKFISSSNSLQLGIELLNLNLVNFSLSSSQFYQNKLAQYQNISLINVSASVITLQNILFKQNYGNIQLLQSETINIDDSFFTENINENGGSLSIQHNTKNIFFTNATFVKNRAFANGGAIFFKDIYGSVTLDKSSSIINNTALIGGGVRIYNTQNKQYSILHSLQKQLALQQNIIGNNAMLYGDNIATILSKLTITQIRENQVLKSSSDFFFYSREALNKSENATYSGKLLLNNINSGSEITISLQLSDDFGDILSFDLNLLKNNKYPKIISDELKTIIFKLDNSQTNSLLLNGDTQLNWQSFNKESLSYNFQKLQIMSFPLTTSNVSLTFTTFEGYQNKPLLVQIDFRNCEKGEILQQHNQNIFRCYKCPKGYYSLKEHSVISRNDSKNIQEILIQNKCIRCPSEADYCEGSTLQLKSGYWRSEEAIDDIIYCADKPQNCQRNEKNNQSCIQGMIGPLCEECDSFGEYWDGSHYTLSYTNNFECTNCDNLYIPLILLFFLILVIFLYCLLSVIMFISSFSHNQICFYLRQLQMFPISKSCFKDYSSFYLKILLNYMQITSYIIETRKMFPNNVNTSFILIQSPSFYFIAIADCLTNRLVKDRISRANLISFFVALFPFICMIVVYCLVRILYALKIIRINKSYKRTLLNLMIVFFQPSQITYFTTAMGCNQIGQSNFTKLDYLIECNDPQYLKFALPFSISVLAFWIFIPLIILYQLRKKKDKLNFCKTKFQYGYFYSEYHEQYYYWEFVRIYIRIAIVFAFALIYFLSFVSLVVISLLLFYIKLIYKLNPIINKDLQRIDITQIFIIVICIILTKLNQSYQFFAISFITYFIYCLFILICFYMIACQKLNSELNYFGRLIRWIIKKTCTQQFYEKFTQKNNTHFSTFMRWRFLKRRIQEHLLMRKLQKKSTKLLTVNTDLRNIGGFGSIRDMESKDSPEILITPQSNQDFLQQDFFRNRNKSVFHKENLAPIQETIDSTDGGDVKDDNTLNQTPYQLSTMLMFSDKRIFREKYTLSEVPSNETFAALERNDKTQTSFLQFNRSFQRLSFAKQ